MSLLGTQEDVTLQAPDRKGGGDDPETLRTTGCVGHTTSINRSPAAGVNSPMTVAAGATGRSFSSSRADRRRGTAISKPPLV